MQTMKNLITSFLFLLSFNLLAAENSCSKKGFELEGRYGKYKSPILKVYSEASGNLEEIEVQSKQKYSKLEFVFSDENDVAENPIELKLKDNKTSAFNFNKVLSMYKTRPAKLTIRVFRERNVIVCSQEVSIVQRDGQDGVLKKL